MFSFNKLLINKLILLDNYKSIWEIPQLKKLVLHFGIKNIVFNNKQILSGCLALNILSEQKSILCYSTKSIMFLKIKQGMVVSCKITLRKNLKYKFLNKFIIYILNYNKIKLFKYTSISLNSLTIRIDDLFLFKNLEKFFEYFDDLSFLNISFISNSKNKMKSFIFFNILGLCNK